MRDSSEIDGWAWQSPLGLDVRDYGAIGNGVADDTVALRAALAVADGRPIYFPPGTYLTDTLTVLTGHRLIGANSYGTNFNYATAAAGASVLRAKNAGTSLIEITGGTAGYQKAIEVGHLAMVGFGGPLTPTGTGHGIYAHDNPAGGGASHLYLHDLTINGMGGHGLYLVEAWHSDIDRVWVDSCGDHAFDLQGGNTTTLRRCYPVRVPSGKAGYRIHCSATLIGCNGIDSVGSDWGVFGDRLTDGDTQDAAFFGTLIGCNLEGFGNRGIWLKYGGVAHLHSCTFQSPTSGTVIALQLDFPGDGMVLDTTTSFTLKGSAAWANGYAIHLGSGVPPICFGSIAGVWVDEDSGNMGWVDDPGFSASLPTIDVRNGMLRLSTLNIASSGYQAGVNYVTSRWLAKDTRTTTWDPGSVANGAVVSVDIAQPLAAVGDEVAVSFSQGIPLGCVLSAAVLSTGHVGVVLRNDSGSPVDLDSGTLRVTVIKH